MSDTPGPDRTNIPFFRSLRVRIPAIVIGFLVVVLTIVTIETISQVQKASTASLEHEGLLLSNMLEAGIASLADARDFPAIQAYIDRVIALRDKNDIEINVLMKAGDASEIVASNDPGNIEATDAEEHNSMLLALQRRSPVIFIAKAADDLDPDDNPDSRYDPTHTDYYIDPAHRFMSITTPLVVKDQELGSINVLLSLKPVDLVMDSLYARIIVSSGVGLVLLAAGVSFYLSLLLFRPLRRLVADIHQFGIGGGVSRSLDRKRRDEIGVINTEFTRMVDRITRAEADNKAYLEEIEHQKDQVESLLRNILPRSIIERMHTGEEMIADGHKAATILFADLVGFTKFAANKPPETVVQVLNGIFQRFDDLALEHGVEKIKTIGDAYMGVAGLPLPCADHQARAARLALDMAAVMREMNEKAVCDFGIRIGLHSGPVVAGVIGKHKFAYDVWGDAVNIASRYEASSEPGRIHISAAVAAGLSPSFQVESRGRIDIRDVGVVESYFLNR